MLSDIAPTNNSFGAIGLFVVIGFLCMCVLLVLPMDTAVDWPEKLTPNEHALAKHGADAQVVADAYNSGRPCHMYDSDSLDRRMYRVNLLVGSGVIITVKSAGRYVTSFPCNDGYLRNIIARDGYVCVASRATD